MKRVQQPSRRSSTLFARLERPWQVDSVRARAHEAWNGEDVATQRRMAAQGQPLAEIARVLERSQSAVQGRAKRLKLKVTSRGGDSL